MHGGVDSTVHSAERSFEALPSRQFGPALPIDWQQLTGLQIIEASPPGQGSDSAAKASAEPVSGEQEELAAAQLSRAPCKPFFYP